MLPSSPIYRLQRSQAPVVNRFQVYLCFQTNWLLCYLAINISKAFSHSFDALDILSVYFACLITQHTAHAEVAAYITRELHATNTNEKPAAQCNQ